MKRDLTFDGVLWAVLRLLLIAAYLVFIFLDAFWGLQNTYSPDTNWIVRTGEIILSTGTLPQTDVLSWSMPDKPLVAYQWLFEVLCAALVAGLGIGAPVGLAMFINLMSYIVLPLVAFIPRRVPLLFSLGVATAALTFAIVGMSLRPMIMTSLCLLGQFYLLKLASKKRLLFWQICVAQALLYVLWANVHILVFMGPLMLMIMALGDDIQREGLYVYSPADRRLDDPPLAARSYVILALVAISASLINPYGWRIYEYIFELMNSTKLSALIGELQSMDFHQQPFKAYLFVLGGMMLLITRAQQVIPARNLLLLMFINLAAMYSVRMTVWANLCAVLFLPNALYQAWFPLRKKLALTRELIAYFERWRTPILNCFYGVTMAVVVLPVFQPDAVKLGRCEDFKPLVAVYKEQRIATDRFINDDLTGCCLIGQLPDQKVFIDNRFDFYGEDFVLRYKDEFIAGGDWKAFMKRWKANGAILSKSQPVVALIRADPEFTKLYEDDKFIVFRRASTSTG